MSTDSTTFIVLTGNGLSVSEDLARRFLSVSLDSGSEDPETRPFNSDFIGAIRKARTNLLSAALTILRWGRITRNIEAGEPLGSFEMWCEWVRDPLVSLGCADPTERIREAKKTDRARREVAELYETWWSCHGDKARYERELAPAVQALLDPHGQGRQFRASRLSKLVGTRIAGKVLLRQDSAGNWGAATYRLQSGIHTTKQGKSIGGIGGPRATQSCDGPYGPYAKPRVDTTFVARLSNKSDWEAVQPEQEHADLEALWREKFEEGAAIAEYEGANSRAEAEEIAILQLTKDWVSSVGNGDPDTATEALQYFASIGLIPAASTNSSLAIRLN